MMGTMRPPAPSGKMTSRERVHAAAAGKPVDRVPVMYYLNPHTTCRLIAEFQPARNRFANIAAGYLWKRFCRGGGLDAPEIWRALPYLFNAYGYGAYSIELGADILLAPLGANGAIERLYVERKHLRVLDSYHSVRSLGGIYWDVHEPAIKDVAELKDYRFPDFTADKHYIAVSAARKTHPDACIMVEAFGVQDFFSTQIWSMAPFMMALYDYPTEVKEFMRRFCDWSVDTVHRGVKAGADAVFIYDDYGYNDRPFMSMKMWKEFTFPHLKRIVEAVHDAGALAMLHSCGVQTPFLEYYVEAGVDILQAFQPKAGNDFRIAYEKYGDRLAFATGIDIQLGEQINAQEMRESILNSYRIGRSHGRHILGMTHMLQYTMPADNIRAIFDTVREIQSGEHNQ